MILAMVIVAAAAVALGAAWRGRKSWPGLSTEDRLLALAALPALFSLLYIAANSVGAVLSDSWSYVRLMPSVALLRGYSLYYPLGEGPISGWLYGPVVPLAQLPAALLPHPVAALIGAGILNEAMLLLPLFAVIVRTLPASPRRAPVGLLLLAGLVALLLQNEAFAYWIRKVQVDTFAIGLWVLGVAALLNPDTATPISTRRLWTAGVLLAASAWSKQNEALILPLPVLYLWLSEGRKPALRLALAIVAAGSLILVFCIAVFGWKGMFLNLWQVPAHHPWQNEFLTGMSQMGWRLLEQIQWVLILFLGLAVRELKAGPRAATADVWVRSHPWILPAAAALVILPMSVLGRLKVGGDDNSYHSIYFLAAAVGMLAARRMSADENPVIRRTLAALAVVGLLLVTVQEVRVSPPLDAQYRDSRLGKEYRFCREHPGEVWFSSNPLATLYSDGKLYHQGYGVYDRFLAQAPPDAAQLKEHLPAKLRWVSTPGPPFWVPDSLSPIPPPPGLRGEHWLEVKKVPD